MTLWLGLMWVMNNQRSLLLRLDTSTQNHNVIMLRHMVEPHHAHMVVTILAYVGDKIMSSIIEIVESTHVHVDVSCPG